MTRIILSGLFALFMWLLVAYVAYADQTYRVFDKDQNVVEIWREKDGLIEVYNPDMSRKGYIKKEGKRLEKYDKDWRREGRAEGDSLDPQGEGR